MNQVLWHLFPTAHHPEVHCGEAASDGPLLLLQEGLVFEYEPRRVARAGRPIYRLIEDRLHTTAAHPAGRCISPWFRIEGRDVFTAIGHPNGVWPVPWFRVKALR